MKIKVKNPQLLLRKRSQLEKSDWLQDAGAWGHLKVCYVGTAKSTNDCYLTSISYGLEVHRELMKAAITDSLNFKAGGGTERPILPAFLWN